MLLDNEKVWFPAEKTKSLELPLNNKRTKLVLLFILVFTFIAILLQQFSVKPFFRFFEF